MIDISIHSHGKARCECFYPDNSNSVTLEINGGNVTIFDLPYEKAEALARIFADEETRLYSKGAGPRPFLAAEAV